MQSSKAPTLLGLESEADLMPKVEKTPCTQRSIKIIVFCRPEPQGSTRAFIPKGWSRAIITSDNKDLKSFRQEVSKAALVERQRSGYTDVIFGKHEPVEMVAKFFFNRPPSIPKRRKRHVVKPDLSKLVRSAEDSLTGIIYADDSQVVECHSAKDYGQPERVEIEVTGVL